MSLAPATCCFVVPALDGPISGGTSYNRELCAALAQRGASVEVCTLDDPRLAARLGAARHTFVDTLYLEALPELARGMRGTAILLTHFLPSFVAAAGAVGAARLSLAESRALLAAGAFLVTSEFMREALEPLVAPEKPILVVQPGSRAALAPSAVATERGTRALMIANLLPGKGIAPFLRALAARVLGADRFELSIVGSWQADRAYAAQCRRVIEESSALSARVTLRGALSPEQTLSELGESELLISASVMESFGMALLDARTSGIPILAHSGGHVAAHIDSAAGGQLAASAAELAATFLELTRAPQRLAERRQQARRHAPAARPWSLAAGQLLDQLGSLEK